MSTEGSPQPSPRAAADPDATRLAFALTSVLEGDDLEVIQNSCRALDARLPCLVETWRELYVEWMGSARSLRDREFDRLLGAQLRGEIASILAGDVASVARGVADLAADLAARRVPFAEVIVIKLLLARAMVEVVLPEFPTGAAADTARTRTILDSFAHGRTLLLASVYFHAHTESLRSKIRMLEQDARILDPQVTRRSIFHGIVGASPSMRALYGRIAAAASGRGTALVVGETGTGKELVARALHDAGDPSGSPFVAVNCAALPSELVESELFGHASGSFTGAQGRFEGLVRAAHGGTLFLDEITEMQTGAQAKLLRVLQERRVRAVGSLEEHAVDVRVVASTNTEPVDAVAAGKLREDLYYRLKVHTLRVPPLRERREDVPLLARHFIALLSGRYAHSVAGIDDRALDALAIHDWPGNVRELMGVIESAIAYGSGDTILREHLPLAEMQAPVPRSLGAGVVTFEEAERTLIERALERTGGNKSEAARILGISRKQLYVRLARYGSNG